MNKRGTILELNNPVFIKTSTIKRSDYTGTVHVEAVAINRVMYPSGEIRYYGIDEFNRSHRISSDTYFYIRDEKINVIKDKYSDKGVI